MKKKTKDEWAVYADTVKENVSALDVGRALGLEIRRGRCKCPIHGGHDYNCVLYPGNRGFACHVCKAGGDVIQLVRKTIPGMTFPDALRWFNAMFNLGMDIDSYQTEERLKKAQNALKRKRERARFIEHIDQINYDIYLKVLDEAIRLQELRDESRPHRYSEEWSRQFCECIELIPEIEEYLTYFAIESTVTKK